MVFHGSQCCLGLSSHLETKQKFEKVVYSLSRYTKFGQAHLNKQEKIRHSLIWHFIWDFQI